MSQDEHSIMAPHQVKKSPSGDKFLRLHYGDKNYGEMKYKNNDIKDYATLNNTTLNQKEGAKSPVSTSTVYKSGSHR
jgi:hypothetical protein